MFPVVLSLFFTFYFFYCVCYVRHFSLLLSLPPSPFLLSPLTPTLLMYPGDLVFFFLYLNSYMSLLWSSLFLGSLGLCIVDCFLFALCLTATYEWAHMIFIFLSLGYLTQYVFFLDPSICLQISRCHYFVLLRSTPLCKCTTFS